MISGGGLRPRTGAVSRAFCGFCKPERRGAFCRRSVPRPQPAGGDCRHGRSRESSWRHGGLCWECWMNKGCCSGMGLFWTAVSLRPKKGGLWSRENQAGQGHEVDDTGRRSRSSAGSSAGKCLSGRSYACGGHARRSPRSTAPRRAAAKAKAGDRRPRLRLRPAARAAEETRHRLDRTLSGKQQAAVL